MRKIVYSLILVVVVGLINLIFLGKIPPSIMSGSLFIAMGLPFLTMAQHKPPKFARFRLLLVGAMFVVGGILTIVFSL